MLKPDIRILPGQAVHPLTLIYHSGLLQLFTGQIFSAEAHVVYSLGLCTKSWIPEYYRGETGNRGLGDKKRVLAGQSFYLSGALLCLISTWLSKVVIVAVQRKYAPALLPRRNNH